MIAVSADWGWRDGQWRQVVVALAARGCPVLLNNPRADEITALHERNAEARAPQRGTGQYLIPNVGPVVSAAT